MKTRRHSTLETTDPTAIPPRRSTGYWLAVAMGALMPLASVWAEPVATGATPGVQIDNPSAGVTHITAPDNAIIDYASFNVGPGESVRFFQPDASSRVLNRIHSNTPSQIDGTITANGIVYFVNPAGVQFGPTSVIDVAGLFAAGGSLSNDDFLAGVNRFNAITGDVSNMGTIRASTIAALVGRDVTNGGTISVPNGTAVLAAGDQVLIGSPLGGLMVAVEVTPGDGAVTNTGTIDAAEVSLVAGDMYSLAVTAAPAQAVSLYTPPLLEEADIDGDGDIDFDDINTAIANYTGSLNPGTGGKVQAQGDTDGDGDVDDFDMINLIVLYTGPILPPLPPIAGEFNLDTFERIVRQPALTSEVNLTEADLDILRSQVGVSPRPLLPEERVQKAQARALYDDLRARGDVGTNPDGSLTIANTRLDADVVRRALQLYREKIQVEGVDPAQRLGQIREAIGEAFMAFTNAGLAADGFDAAAFSSYVRNQNPDLFSDLGALDELRRLTLNMGLNDLEQNNSERVIIERTRPGSLDYGQMKATLEAAGQQQSIQPTDAG